MPRSPSAPADRDLAVEQLFAPDRQTHTSETTPRPPKDSTRSGQPCTHPHSRYVLMAAIATTHATPHQVPVGGDQLG
jgi:hypothetical protein